MMINPKVSQSIDFLKSIINKFGSHDFKQLSLVGFLLLIGLNQPDHVTSQSSMDMQALRTAQAMSR